MNWFRTFFAVPTPHRNAVVAALDALPKYPAPRFAVVSVKPNVVSYEEWRAKYAPEHKRTA